MTRLVLDKNPDPKLEEKFAKVRNLFEQNTMNSITYSEPFLKTLFLADLIPSLKNPTIYLDFDLLYSGYIISETIPSIPNVTLFQPTKSNWNEILKTILPRISQEKSTLIIDSLNGFYNLFYENQDVGRLVNSYIMLFVSISKMSESNLLLTTMVKRKDKDQWVLSNIGRQVIETKKMTKIHLDKKNSHFELNIRSNSDSTEKQTIEINSELI